MGTDQPPKPGAGEPLYVAGVGAYIAILAMMVVVDPEPGGGRSGEFLVLVTDT